MRRALVALCAGTLLSAPAFAGVCHSWSDGDRLGALDSRLAPEASGLAASRAHPRLYHVNDSGDGPFLYVSDLSGDGLRRLRLGGVQAVFDAEALALGTLFGEPTLIVGDIGDNLLQRRTVDLLAIRERDITPDAAPVFGKVAARYPDGPHNAEALLLAPDGRVYVLTKSWTERGRDPAASRLYRVDPDAWKAGGGPVTMAFVGEIDFPALSIRERVPLSDVVTDAAMSADGSRFLVLTYGYAWEFALDLAPGALPPTADLKRGRDYQVIRLAPMLGKETIAYLPGDRSFLYGKEFKPDSKPSELIRVDCLD